MKNVYYKRLIADRQCLNATERIVFSFLVYCSICDLDDVWDKETGTYDKYALEEYGDTFPLPNYMFDFEGIFCYGNKISKQTGVSQPSVSRAINKLHDMGIVYDNNTIKHCDIYVNGFFTLDNKSGLKNELLIFYSWLKNLRGNDKFIFSTRKRLSEMYGYIGEKNIRDYLQRLKKLGLVERDEYKRLIIKK